MGILLGQKVVTVIIVKCDHKMEFHRIHGMV